MSPLATALCSVMLTLAPQASGAVAPTGSVASQEAVAARTDAAERVIWVDPHVEARAVSALVGDIRRQGSAHRVDASIVVGSSDPGSKDVPKGYGILLRGPKDAVDAAAGLIRRELGEQDTIREVETARLDAATVSVDFPGGTVEEFVTAALGKFEFVPPVYGDDAIRSLRVRPVKTHRMSISAALELLTRVPPTDASGEPVRLRITGAGETIVGGASPVVAAERTVDLQRSRVIVIERDPEALELSQPVRRAAIFLPPTRSSDAAIEELLDAISVAVHLEKRSPTFVAKMHRPSRMLIVRGTEDELGVVAQVVRGFEPNVRIELPTFSAADAPTRPTSDAPAGR